VRTILSGVFHLCSLLSREVLDLDEIPGVGERMNPIEKFQQLKEQHTQDEKALSDLFDSLEPATCEEIISPWRGGGFDTGHWLLQALVEMKWYGKWFISKIDAIPLICVDEEGRLYSNKSMNGEGSLWMMDFRGKVSATIVYDGQPMFGHFRKLDDNTLLGVVSGKTLSNGKNVEEGGKHQYFYLERVKEYAREIVNK
jgi:GXWXG protein/uncharacterized protein DUF4334